MDKGERRLLQLGGISGILSGALLASAFVFGQFLAPPYVGPEESILQYSQNSAPFIANTGLFLLFGLLSIPFFLALYRSLRKASVGYALVGVVLGLLSLVFLVAFTTLSSASASAFASRYNEATNPADRKMFVTMFDSLDSLLWGGLALPAFFLFALTILVFGAAMLGSAQFRKAYGWMSVIFGLVIPIGVLGFIGPTPLLVIVWFVVVGWKLYGLSKS